MLPTPWLTPTHASALSLPWRCIYAILEGVELFVSHPFHKRVHRHLKHAFIPHKGNGYHPHVLRSHHLFGHAAAFTALKVGVVLFASLIPSEAFLAPDVLAEQGARILALTNQARVEQGLPELQRSSLLVSSSVARATDMSEHEYFSHVSPDGHRLSYFLAKAGYRYSSAGENLAMGFSDAEGAMRGWMKSPTHYANIVDTEFQELGVGVVGGMYQGKPTVFVAQHFGLPLAAPVDAPKAVPAPIPAEPSPVPNPEPTRIHPEPEPGPAAVARAPSRVAGVVSRVASRPVAVTSTAEEVMVDVPVPVPVSAIVTSPASSTPRTVSTTIAVAATNPSPDAAGFSLDASRSFIAWSQRPAGGTVLHVQARITGDVYHAQVAVNGYTLQLKPNGEGFYEGSLTIPESSDELFEAIVPGTLEVTLQNGKVEHAFLDWKDPKIQTETPWDRYVQAKSWLSKSIPVFTIVRWLFLVGGGFFALALILNIVIEARKQHPKVILQTAALIALLVLYAKW